MEDNYKDLMEECIAIAKKSPFGIGRPYVGSLVLDNAFNIVGRGYKQYVYGTRMLIHAERVALDEANEKARDATIITTLEPCGKIRRSQIFKSCSELIIERGVKKVVFLGI